MILHLFPNEKFTKNYIEFINRNYNENEHEFAIFPTRGKEMDIDLYKNCVNVNYKTILSLFRQIKNADAIMLHSFSISRVILLFLFRKRYLKKVNWVIWGCDLYDYESRLKSIIGRIVIKIKSYFVRRIGFITTFVPGDYLLAKKYYGANGYEFLGVYDPLLSFPKIDEIRKKRLKNRNLIKVQVGNSATKSNRHMEILDKLLFCIGKKVDIYVPLSYGDEKYAKKVVDYGQTIYGGQFKPILEYMKPLDYDKYLSNIDVGIFNNNRQQATENIERLLYLGCKVFLSPETTMWDYFKNECGYKIWPTTKLPYDNLEEFIFLSDDDINKNIEIYKYRKSENFCRTCWNKIFKGMYEIGE